jgi:hypothetical protein
MVFRESEDGKSLICLDFDDGIKELLHISVCPSLLNKYVMRNGAGAYLLTRLMVMGSRYMLYFYTRHLMNPIYERIGAHLFGSPEEDAPSHSSLHCVMYEIGEGHELMPLVRHIQECGVLLSVK